MPIRDTLIREEAEENVIVLDDAQTVRMAVDIFEKREYEGTNDVFLVVATSDDSYRVTSLLDLGASLEEVGWEQADAPLSDLPIPEAGEVVHRESEGSGSFIARVRDNPGKTFVVVDDANFVALFINPNLQDTGVRPDLVTGVRNTSVSATAVTISITHHYTDPRTGDAEEHPHSYVKKLDGIYRCQTCARKINANGNEIA